MDIFQDIEARIAACLAGLQKDGALPGELAPKIEAEVPRDPSHGDFATNIAMVLAKPAAMKPRDIAALFVERLAAGEDVSEVNVAGPGFINIRMQPTYWHGIVKAVLSSGPDFGKPMLGQQTRTNIEYVSANPTGPMHIGHCRGAVFGDALARLLAFADYDVTREYYINDAGGQIDVLARSVFLRYRQALGEDIGEIPEGLYPGDYLVPVGAALVQQHGKALLAMDEAEWMPIVRDVAIAAMMEAIKADLAALNIRHDVFFSERSLKDGGHDAIRDATQALQDKGLIYEGRLPKPKGHSDEEWEDRDQLLFKSVQFGDDVDRALAKSNGSHTYFAADIAYHRDKLQRGFTHLINVFGADHAGYIKRMKSAVAALSDGTADFDIKVCQLVRLMRGGVPVKMSKRAGTFVTLREVVDEVGVDAVRFMMLYRKNDATLDFDIEKVLEQSKDNPVFYVQYAHARICSLFRMAVEKLPDETFDVGRLVNADVDALVDPGELDLLRAIGRYPRVVTGAGRSHEPHRVAFYLYDLANAIHAQWARGNDSPHLRFIDPDDLGKTLGRLALMSACQSVLASGLGILGVSAPTEMR
ncbi:MAG: arginine--tRNA ligase [Pseudomonadota bacterium]